MNIEKFEGWKITCPSCQHVLYIGYEDIAFNPDDDTFHFIECEKCKKEIEVYYEGKTANVGCILPKEKAYCS